VNTLGCNLSDIIPSVSEANRPFEIYFSGFWGDLLSD
jgi:hypothetical protein